MRQKWWNENKNVSDAFTQYQKNLKKNECSVKSSK